MTAFNAKVANPEYNEEFAFPIPDNFRSITSYRLQFSLWDHQRMKANVSAGGFSFAVDELFTNKQTDGWFDLLPFKEGRGEHRRHGELPADSEDPHFTDADDALPPIDTSMLSPIKGSELPSPQKAPPAAPVPASISDPKPSTTVPMTAVVDEAGDLQPVVSLKRSNSMESLVSVASGNIVSSTEVEGEVHLYMFYRPDDGAKKSNGSIEITVNEARNLSATDPYVKLYISSKGENIKSTKKKTKTQRKNRSPLFQEKFTFNLTAKMSVDENTRLQITVWDHSRSKANECTGGMSFSFAEIASTSRVSGWFELLPYKEGRNANCASASATGSIGMSGMSVSPKLPRALLGASASASASVSDPPRSISGNKADSKSKSKRGMTSILSGSKGKNSKESEEREERHIEDLGRLEEKIQSYREQVEQMAELQTRNLRLQNKLSDTQKQIGRVEQLEADVARLTEENDNLDTENGRLNEFITLHKVRRRAGLTLACAGGWGCISCGCVLTYVLVFVTAPANLPRAPAPSG